MADNTEMINALKHRVKDELEDAMKYMEMSHKARDYGEPQDAQIFRDIAKEEYTHAGHINNILKEHGSNTNEFHDMWVKAQHDVYGI